MRRPAIEEKQPKTFTCNTQALFSLPSRLLNPPVAPRLQDDRNRLGITPHFQVSLDDVLNRASLPPLGLKDFEEWLLYVENCPELLYFILWLKEYTEKYRAYYEWFKNSRPVNGEPRVAFPMFTSSHLGMFYSRAKETFFSVGSVYEINLPSDILSPLYGDISAQHPDPAVFAEVAWEVRKLLTVSLNRMTVAAHSNVGTQRAVCGLAGGVAIGLIGSVIPLVYNLATGHGRHLRWAALPGLWLGLTVFLSALHGVCLMIYVFGDLRQLKKFELARPPISKPQPLTTPRTRGHLESSKPASMRSVPAISQQTPKVAIPPPVVLRGAQPGTRLGTPIQTAEVRARTLSASSAGSSDSYTSTLDEDACGIHISPAYFDDEVEDYDAPMTPVTAATSFRFPARSADGHSQYTATASFIHPYASASDIVFRHERCGPSTSTFDFDSLPPRQKSVAPIPTMNPKDEPRLSITPKGFLAYMQHLCVKSRVRDMIREKDVEKGCPPNLERVDDGGVFMQPRAETHARVHSQFKLIQAVPAFATPITLILNPVVVRAQWEIVVRSASFAVIISMLVVGGFVALPVTHP